MKKVTGKNPELPNIEIAKSIEPLPCPDCGPLNSDIKIFPELPLYAWRVYCASCCNRGPTAATPEKSIEKWNEQCIKLINRCLEPLQCPTCKTDGGFLFSENGKWQYMCGKEIHKGPAAATPRLALDAWGIKGYR